MINLIIVDDEDETRSGLHDFLPWKELGIDAVHTASDGTEAIEMAYQIKPDILITDVRMSSMDGITFAQKAREFLPLCKIIFISGYSDKDYLKSAIKLKAVSYVEKPINLEEIGLAVREAVQLIRDEEMTRDLKNDSQSILQKTNQFLRRELAMELISNNPDINDIKKRLAAFNIDSSIQSSYCSLVIKLCPINDSSVEHNKINSIIENIFADFFPEYLAWEKDDSSFIVHVFGRSIEQNHSFREKCRVILDSLTKMLLEKAKLFVGVGRPVGRLDEIRDSYNSAIIAAQQLFFLGYGQIAYYSQSALIPYVPDADMVKTFEGYLKGSCKSDALDFIRRTTFEIRRYHTTSIDNIKNIYYNLILKITDIEFERGIRERTNISKDSDYLWKLISDKDTLDEIQSIIFSRTESYFSSVDEISIRNSPVYEILRYIHAHFDDNDLSIQKISAHVNLTPSYLCQVFKKEREHTINQYITEYRIEKAKELLRDKQVKLAEVSNKSGYNDAAYFTRLFKRQVGMTPSDYRENYIL